MGINVSEKILWIFLVAVLLVILFVIIRLVSDKDRIFDFYGEKTKVCKYCGESFIRWDYTINKKMYSIWMLPDNKEPGKPNCKCHKIISPDDEDS